MPDESNQICYFILQETDYILNYFDNGEMYGADEEDDNMDEGAIYWESASI